MNRQLSQKGILSTLREFRKQNGYSQEYVAHALAISRTLYNMIEKGRRPFRNEYASILANLYQVEESLFLPPKAPSSSKETVEEFKNRMGIPDEDDSLPECEIWNQVKDGEYEYFCEEIEMNYSLGILLSDMGFIVEYFDEYDFENGNKPFGYCKEMHCGSMQTKYKRPVHKEFYEKYDYCIQKGHSTKKAYFTREDSLNLQREILGFINYKVKEYVNRSKNLYDDSITTSFSESSNE